MSTHSLSDGLESLLRTGGTSTTTAGVSASNVIHPSTWGPAFPNALTGQPLSSLISDFQSVLRANLFQRERTERELEQPLGTLLSSTSDNRVEDRVNIGEHFTQTILSDDVVLSVDLSVDWTLELLDDRNLIAQLSPSRSTRPRRRSHSGRIATIAGSIIPTTASTDTTTLNAARDVDNDRRANPNEREILGRHSVSVSATSPPPVRDYSPAPAEIWGQGNLPDPQTTVDLSLPTLGGIVRQPAFLTSMTDLQARAQSSEKCGYAGERFVHPL